MVSEDELMLGSESENTNNRCIGMRWMACVMFL